MTQQTLYALKKRDQYVAKKIVVTVYLFALFVCLFVCLLVSDGHNLPTLPFQIHSMNIVNKPNQNCNIYNALLEVSSLFRTLTL